MSHLFKGTPPCAIIKDLPHTGTYLLYPCLAVVVGDERVGKTQLLNRYVYNTFELIYKVTIGADFVSKQDVTPSGSKTITQLWVCP